MERGRRRGRKIVAKAANSDGITDAVWSSSTGAAKWEMQHNCGERMGFGTGNRGVSLTTSGAPNGDNAVDRKNAADGKCSG